MSSYPHKKHLSFSFSLLVEGVLRVREAHLKGLARLSFKSRGKSLQGLPRKTGCQVSPSLLTYKIFKSMKCGHSFNCLVCKRKTQRALLLNANACCLSPLMLLESFGWKALGLYHLLLRSSPHGSLVVGRALRLFEDSCLSWLSSPCT